MTDQIKIDPRASANEALARESFLKERNLLLAHTMIQLQDDLAAALKKIKELEEKGDE